MHAHDLNFLDKNLFCVYIWFDCDLVPSCRCFTYIILLCQDAAATAGHNGILFHSNNSFFLTHMIRHRLPNIFLLILVIHLTFFLFFFALSAMMMMMMT